MTQSTTTNVISAFVLRLADQLAVISDSLMPRQETARAVAYIGRTKGGTVRTLSQHISLSHPATVRLADRLSQDGLVERCASEADRRAVELRLTDQGQLVYKELLRRTSLEIERVLAQLSTDEIDAVTSSLAKVLSHLETSSITAAQGCRFCDVGICNHCPVKSATQ